MFPLAGTLPLLLIHAASVSPVSVPARGNREAIITLDRAAMVHVSAQSKRGTSCTLVDHLRGPFISSGEAGRSNCDPDLLLDSGAYKLRLQSANKGAGQARLKVTPFTELNEKVPVLEPRRTIEQDVGPGQQASFWIRVDKRQPVAIHVSGRTAGLVRLWRDGEWSEDLPARQSSFSIAPGQPSHDWWIESTIEPGDYRLTVYGTGVQRWTRGKESNLVSVSLGFEEAPSDRAVALVLPASGFAAYELPKGAVAAFASFQGAEAQLTELTLHSMDDDGQSYLSSQEASCRIEPKALVPECLAIAQRRSRHVLAVRGVPGARLQLQWGTFGEGAWWAGGEYRRPVTQLGFHPPEDGQYLVGIHDVPVDQDAAPLGCTLEEVMDSGNFNRGRDVIAVGPTRPLSRAFNYNGSEAQLLFQVTEGGAYRIATSGGRKSRCELFRLGDGKSERLSETGATGCSLVRPLPPGTYQLSLHGGNPGIEKLVIAQEGARAVERTSTKSSCLLPSVSLRARSEYRLTLSRGGDVNARGFLLRPLPLALGEPLPVVLDGGATVRLSVAAGRPIRVRGAGSPSFSCALESGPVAEAREGTCDLPATTAPDTLVLTSRTQESAALSVSRPVPPPAARPPLSYYTPALTPPPALALGRTLFFDFEREQSHSLVFEVEEAGLYHVTTEGLLATECRIRTPVVSQLAADQGGGRGRNCLLATYLRPGRYLLTVKTTGQSRGRGGVVMTRHPVRRAQDVAAGGETFFRVAAGDLIQQQLTLPRGGQYQLGTTGQGISLQCRLEDRKGWPIVTVPAPCSDMHLLAAGTYLWTQLPVTVESMRHTRVERVEPPKVLSGGAMHPVSLDTWYTARLGKDGKDELTFTLEAPLDVSFVLTQRMQGRLYAVADDGALKPVEIIAPQDEQAWQAQSHAAPDELPSEGGESSDSEPPPEVSEGGEESEAPAPEGDPAPEEESEAPPPERAPPPAPRPPLAPTGQKVALGPGRYKLVTEHSRADVGISYRIYLGSDVLTPGVTRELAAPGRVTLRMPKDGILRLRTEGDTDVRCRLFAGDRLLYESSENGDDWNCALAEPLQQGDYVLALEAETQVPGSTRVSVSTPKVEEAPALASEQVLDVAAGVKVAPLPEAPKDNVQEVDLKSKTRFSCALEGQSGALLHRQTGVRECALLLRAQGERHRLRVWTTGEPAQVSVRYAARPIVPVSWGKVPAGSAGLAKIERPGRYVTDEGVLCLPAEARGLLQPCGPQVSLGQGSVVFSTRGPTAEAKVPLDEQITDLEQPSREALTLARAPFIQRGRSRGGALHLLGVEVPHGERSRPACQLEGGAREQRDAACFAATGATPESVATLWAAGDDPVRAEVTRLAVPLPQEKTTPVLGPQSLTWKGPVIRLALPAEPSRVELTLPEGGWAVRLDAAGAARDLCAPSSGLRHCAVGGRGGEVVLYSPGEPRAEVTVVLAGPPERTQALTGLYEERPGRDGRIQFQVAPVQRERRLEVDGALHCALELADGRRLTSCRATVPAGAAAQLLVDHTTAPLRALLYAPGERERALLSVSAPQQMPPSLAHAQATSLSGALVDRTFKVERPSGVRLEATSGVCALLSGGEVLAASGLDAGCELHRALTPGTYRVLVRAFAGQPLAGTLSWTASPLADISEGVGPEQWIAPGEARLFRFTTRSRGKVGLGLQVPSDRLECDIEDGRGRILGDGCQQYLALDAGTYVLAVRAPRGAGALRFRPVLFGLQGSKRDVPQEYLQEFFQRIGAQP